MRKLWAGSLPLMLVAGSLVAVPQIASPTSALAAGVTSLSPANPIKMERFNYYSAVPTKFVRPVVLQKKVGNSWKTIFSGNTGANGKFRFTVHTGSVDTLRSYSVKTTYKRKTYPAVATAPITVRPLTQSASLSKLGGSAATVTTSPARNGRSVTLQRQSGKNWVPVATGKTNSAGTASLRFTAAAGTVAYRAVASALNGAPAVNSAAKSVTTNFKWHYLTDPVMKDRLVDFEFWDFEGDATIKGVWYPKSVGNDHGARGNSNGTYNLAGLGCTKFEATVGIDDSSEGAYGGSTTSNFEWEFKIFRDNTPANLGKIKFHQSKYVSQNISGVRSLELRGHRTTGQPSSVDYPSYWSYARWGTPRVYCAS